MIIDGMEIMTEDAKSSPVTSSYNSILLLIAEMISRVKKEFDEMNKNL